MDKIATAKRRAELKEYLDGPGVFNVNKCELAKKYGVSDVCIGRDIKIIMGDIKPGDVGIILKRFDTAFQFALNRALRSLNDSVGVKEVNDSIRTLVLVVHEHLSSLAKLGYPVAFDNSETAKPTIEQINMFFEARLRKNDNPPNVIPVDYNNLQWRTRPSIKATVGTLPSSPESIPAQEDDDLEPVEEDDSCQK